MSGLQFVICGNCGAECLRIWKNCPCCRHAFKHDRYLNAIVCMRGSCRRNALVTSNLCKAHSADRKARQARSALQPHCKGCKNQLSLERTKEGKQYCAKCECPEPVPVERVTHLEFIQEIYDELNGINIATGPGRDFWINTLIDKVKDYLSGASTDEG